MSPGPDFLRITNSRQPLPQRGDDGRARYHHGRYGLGGGRAARSEPYHGEDGGCITSLWSAAVCICAGWATDAARALKKKKRKPQKNLKIGAGNGRPELWGTDQSGEPKAIIYFGRCFSLFVGDSVGAGARWGIFLLIVVETFAWFTIVANLFALPAMRRGYQRIARSGLTASPARCSPASAFISSFLAKHDALTQAARQPA